MSNAAIIESAIQGYRISPQQERLWLLTRDHERTPYRAQCALRIEGPIDALVVQRAVRQVVERHEILRTTFQYLPGMILPVQVIHNGDLFAWEEHDLTGLSKSKQQATVETLRHGAWTRPLEFSCGPLLNLMLLKLGRGSYLLMVTLPALCADSAALGNVAREIARACAMGGDAHSVADACVQYADFAEWQHSLLDGDGDSGRKYWRKQALSHSSSVFHARLPFELSTTESLAFAPLSRNINISADLADRINELAESTETSVAAVFIACWQVLLDRLTDQMNIRIGATCDNRIYQELKQALGPFSKFLPVYCGVGRELTFRAALAQFHAALSASRKWQEYFAWDEINPSATDAWNRPFFHFCFEYDEQPVPYVADVTSIDIEWSRAYADRFRVMLGVVRKGSLLEVALHYDASIYPAGSITTLADQYETLLSDAIFRPDEAVMRLRMLSDVERQRVVYSFNPTQGCSPQDTCLHELIEAQVIRTPEAKAVVCGDQSLGYVELDRRANQLARYLLSRGVAPDVLVAISVERSIEMVVGLLGILKAGGAYVPIDPGYPKDRIRVMLEDSRVSLLLTQERLLTNLPAANVNILCLDRDWPLVAEYTATAPNTFATSANLAYVIFTSGSTGKPKGVMVSHDNVVQSTRARSTYYHEPIRSFLLFSSFAFDSSVAGLFWTLSTGGCLCIPDEEAQKDPLALLSLMSQQRVSHLLCLPSFYAVLLQQITPAQAGSLCTVIVAGEACPQDVVTQHYRKLSKAHLFNEYGPTEGTVWSSVYQVGVSDRELTVPIGSPIAHTQICVLDTSLEPVPIGISGELYIGGAGLARGYMNRPELTAERFIPNPFNAELGERLYRTGDLTRYCSDGNLEHLGRIDHQVKVRGFRIELGEIEARLLEHPQVREAVVIAREDTPGDKRLVGYVVGQAPVPSVDALRTRIQQTLPEYMVPVAFVFLEAMPLTPNGKVDRKGLPAPDVSAQLAHQYVAPRTSTEEVLAHIWAEVLGVERVGVHDNFFELGGHSLLAVTLIERMRRQGVEVDVRALFITPTVAGLGGAVGGERVVEVPPNRIPAQCGAITSEMLPLVALDQAEVDRIVGQVPGGVGNVQDIYPLAPLQEGILFHHLMVVEGDTYLTPSLLAFDTRERLDGFLGALQAVIDRHDILRTAVVWEGLPEPVQVVWREAPSVVEEVTFDAELGEAAEQLRVRFDPRHFRLDVRQAPLVRGFIAYDVAQGRWLLLLLSHLLAIDHTTLEILVDEVQAHVRGEAHRLPAPLPFRNFVAQARLGVSREEHEAFFREMLGDVEEPTTPFGLLDVQGDGSGIEEASLELDRELARRLRARARTLGVSAASLCHVAFAQVLARTSGREDVVFGTVLFGRMQGGAGADRVLGMFINTLPVRIKVDEEGVEDAVRHTHRCLAELLRHEHASLALAQRCSAVPAPAPLFSALFNYRYSLEDEQVASVEAASVWDGIEILDSEERTNYPFSLDMDDLGEGFRLTAQMQRPIAPERLCGYMQTALMHLVEALETAPDTAACSIDVLPANERRQLCNDWNATVHAYAEPRDLIGRFEARVEETPESCAVACGDARLTYGELNTRANRVAHGLSRQGVGPDALVALLDDRGVDFLVMMLGIFKSGGAYVPLDPAHPDGRMVQVLEESGVRFTLCGETYRARAESLIETAAVPAPTLVSLAELEAHADLFPNPPRRHTEQNLAFVIYTSGSTGKPKGAMVEHRGMFNNLITKVPALGLSSTDVIAQTASQCFDISVWQFLTALVIGARVEVFPDEISHDPARLLEQLTARGVTILETVPSMIRALLEIAEVGMELPALRWLMPCGEAFPPELCRRWMQRFPDLKLLNAYGPAECSDDVSYHPIELPGEGDPTVPIGRPVHNTRLYLLNRWLEPVPIGVPGEICVGSVQMGRGYLNRSDLTAAAFIPDPFGEDGGRLYRSGDLGRYRSDGVLEFLGRIDHQVKIRGHRIEPGEIEACLVTHREVREACVVPREVSEGMYRLVAYVVGAVREGDELRAHILKTLPEYMVPAAFVFLEAMPLTPNGKVDRKRLPDPDIEAQLVHQYVAPRNPTEEILANIWADVLGIKRVGIHDNFFALGGHSLLATQVISRIRHIFKVELPLRSLFESPMVMDLKEALDRHEHTPGQVTRIAELRQKIGKLSPEDVLAQIRGKRALREARGGVADG